MHTVSLARRAMATRFEIVLHGDDPVALRAAGEEALDEIERIEAQLSFYRVNSEIARLNARAAAEPVRVEPRLFRLLERAREFHAATAGAFDLTIAPLLRCWGLTHGPGRVPESSELESARACVGLPLVQLEEAGFTVRFARPGVMLDPGALGKGYALDRAVEILREAGVTRALLHGGTSTVCALGAPPDATAWNVAIEKPATGAGAQVSRWTQPPTATDSVEPERRFPTRRDPVGTEFQPAGAVPGAPVRRLGAGESVGTEHEVPPELLAVIPLRDESLSVSAAWGKSFVADGKLYGHVLDPRTGQPVDRAWLAAVVLPSATESDALSTALLTLGPEGIETLARFRPQARLLVVAPAGDGESFQVATRGIEVRQV